jgi:RNA recognition motif-containing protein
MKALTTDVEEVKRALREAESEVFVADEEGGMVKRRNPLPEAQDIMAKSVYVKGFPATATLDDLLSFFKADATFGKTVEAVRMRRFPKSKDFKGSVFVEFASESAAQAFLANPVKSYQDQPLTVMSKLAYFESKNSKAKNNVDVEAEFEKLANDYTKGCIAKLAGVPENSAHQQVKKVIADLISVDSQMLSDLDSLVAFVEQQQDNAVFVRLKEPKAAELVAAITEKGFKLGESDISASVPTEEEEAKYYRNLAAVMISKRSAGKYRQNNNNNKKYSTKKRDATPADEADSVEPESKIAKQDD